MGQWPNAAGSAAGSAIWPAVYFHDPGLLGK